jgi:hypothetical protein
MDLRAVRDDWGLVVAFEDGNGVEVRQVLRDDRGRLIGVRDLSTPVEKAVQDAVAAIEAEMWEQEKRLTEQTARVMAFVVKAITPPRKAEPTVPRYHVLLAEARRHVRLDGGRDHVAYRSAVAAADSGDVARAVELLEGIGRWGDARSALATALCPEAT